MLARDPRAEVSLPAPAAAGDLLVDLEARGRVLAEAQGVELLVDEVSSTETWDGTHNPHAGDGVTVSGSGTVADPYTYTIPNGMQITSGGTIVRHNAGDYHIKFVIQGGNLQMDAGAKINVERYGIRAPPNKTFVLDLSGTNSITGAGQIGPITTPTSTPRVVTIQNVKDISLASIDLHVEDVVANPIADRPLTITASGAVVVTGVIDNGDRQTGGNGGGDIIIKANSMRPGM